MSAGMPCVASCGLSVGCNRRSVSLGRVLEAKAGAQEQDNTGTMGELAPARRPGCLQPRHGPPTCSRCSANTEQEGNDVILEARSRVLAFNLAEHPDGLDECEKLRLKAGGLEGRAVPGGEAGRGLGASGLAGRGRTLVEHDFQRCAREGPICYHGRSLIRVCSTACVHDALGR